eukprot:CAMPEP_0197849810 /NCGR_PEP_ID=MMETSP1438-20131217/13290_1 /TAXON_ID=1461541 /ORGANISM="Pterosperma sp., Strain CCMP1384" /LENGTH=233 /DNA_ID=CAMNT_0043462659 /DNA_START=180 /DNA_END=881 /DNA_ORIENTATION=-
MTTAHRPTWAPAKGKEEEGGYRMFGASKQYSSRDAPSHTKLKERADGQGSTRDLKARDLKEELEERESKHQKKRTRAEAELGDIRALEGPGPSARPGGGERKEATEDRLVPKAADADESEDEDDSDDDSDEDEKELLAELERIKKERAEEAARKEAEAQKEAADAKAAELAVGNPLTAAKLGAEGDGFSVKRRWDDDVVFKNQTRNEPEHKQRFINDTIRNDFHRRFLNKYMK